MVEFTKTCPPKKKKVATTYLNTSNYYVWNVSSRIYRGRCIYAKVAFKEGDIIFEEDPLVCCQFAWNKEYKYLACDFCMRPLESVVENIRRLVLDPDLQIELMFEDCDVTDKSTHTNCDFCNAMYCCSECKDNAFKQYHRNLCYKEEPGEPIFELNNKWKDVHKPPETTSIMLLARVIATIELSDNLEETYNEFMKFCYYTTDESEKLIHRMMSEEFSKELEELSACFIYAMKSRKNVTSNGYVDSLLTKDGFIKLLAMLGRNAQGVGTSPLAQWNVNTEELNMSEDQREALDKQITDIYEKVEEVSGPFLNTEGSALYTLHRNVNHNCEPNAESTFPHNCNKLALKALTDIMPGEEICVNYIDCCEEMSYHERQQYLRDNYLFECTCLTCEKEISGVEQPAFFIESADIEMDN